MSADIDPMNVSDDEEAWTCTLKVEGEPYLPLRAYNNEVQLDHGADPMAAVIGAHANLNEEERVISRLVLKPLPRDWSEPYKRLALGGAGSHNQQQSIEEQCEKSKANQTDVKDDTDKNLPVIGLIAIIAVGVILGYRWFQNLTELAQIMIRVGGTVIGGALLVGLVMFFLRRKGPKEPDYFNPSLVSNRIDNLAYEAEVQITVVIARRVTRTAQSMGRASGIMRGLVQAYKHFDHPEGSNTRGGRNTAPHRT